MIETRSFSQLMPFIGRTHEIDEISRRLSDVNCRLLTVLGPGGIGKTRLAVEVAKSVQAQFPEGVHFVNFQSISSADVLAATVADALNLPFSDQSQLQTHLLNFLSTKKMLLLLDNLEHLLTGIGWVSELLVNAPGIKILATSRSTLKLREEWLYPIRGLTFPTVMNKDEFEHYEAIRVFLQAARRVRPDFALAGERDGILRICRQTEGIPLALEMAASWVKVLSCQRIADEMQRNLDLLMISARNVPERHRSMRAVFNHSWQLLNEDERVTVMKLSVFHGGFTLDAAEAIAGASLPVIALLVEKSLVRRLSSNRFTMHELLRQFVLQKFSETPEVQEATQELHSNYFVELLYSLSAHLRNKGEHAALQAIEKDIDNIRGCWDRLLAQGDIEALHKCIQPLQVFYSVRDRAHEGERVFSRAIEVISQETSGSEHDLTLGLLLMGLGKCCMRIGEIRRSKKLLQQSVQLLDQDTARQELGWAKLELACTLHELGAYHEAIFLLEESQLLGELIHDEALIAWSYFELSYSVRMDGRFAEAMQYMQESAFRIRKTGDEDGIGLVLRGLADRYLELGEYSKAKHLYQESLAIHQKLGYQSRLTMTLASLGKARFALGEFDEAHQAIDHSLEIARLLGSPRRLVFSLVDFGYLTLALGEVKAAQGIFDEALSITLQMGDTWQQGLALRGLGKAAFEQHQYLKAYRYFSESLMLVQKNDIRLESAYGLAYLGQAATVMGKYADARRYFCNALQIGLETQIAPVLLHVVFGVAKLLQFECDYAFSVKLLGMVLNHPASHHEIRSHALQVLDELKLNTSINMYIAASKRAQSMTLVTTAKELLEKFSANTVSNADVSETDLLSERELQVLDLIAHGLTNRQIATKLIIAEGTVKWYTTQIYGKLGVQNRTQAIRRAQEVNLLQ